MTENRLICLLRNIALCIAPGAEKRPALNDYQARGLGHWKSRGIAFRQV